MIGQAPPAIIYPEGPELLVCVAGRLDETVRCECGRPLCTPRLDGTLVGSITLDYLRCRCGAHVVLTVEA